MLFEIRALGPDAAVVTMTVDAADAHAARDEAASRGYKVLSARVRRGALNLRVLFRKRFDVALFSQELLSLLEAGLSLVEAIDTLAEKAHGNDSNDVLLKIRQALFEGQPLSHGLQQFPLTFPALYVAAIKASEKTGNMAETLERYVAYQKQLETVRKKLVSASIYPLLLMIVGMVVVLFLMGYVVPKFAHIYSDMGGDLPLLSRWLLYWGELMQAHGLAALGALAVFVCGAAYLLSLPATRAWGMRQVWRIPGVGEHMRVYQLARFYRTVGMLLRGGTPLVTALDMVGGLLQPALRAQLAAAAAVIREGSGISQSLASRGLTTAVSLRMLRVGERTGALDEMMERIAAFHDEDTARWVEWFTRLFEPLLMAFIGIIIGMVVVLMYLPVFELAGGIQ